MTTFATILTAIFVVGGITLVIAAFVEQARRRDRTFSKYGSRSGTDERRRKRIKPFGNMRGAAAGRRRESPGCPCLTRR